MGLCDLQLFQVFYTFDQCYHIIYLTVILSVMVSAMEKKLRGVRVELPKSHLPCVLVYQTWCQFNAYTVYFYLKVRYEKCLT